MISEQREFPETDLTKFVLRTKHAPLSPSGTHEVVATFMTRSIAKEAARRIYGTRWHRTYEIKEK